MHNKRNRNREIYVLVYMFLIIFLILIGYFAYYVQFVSIDQVNNSYNTRQEKLAKRIIRGNIVADDGKTILSGTRVDTDGSETRVYPYGKTFAHVVGYSTKGRTGIELLENISLLTSNANIGERIANELGEEKNMGDTIVSTLNVGLQESADAALGDNKGAIIAIEPETGMVKALVSHPAFDPNDIVSSWEELNQQTEDAPLLNRAVSGLYPPGSTFKIVTLLEYLRENDEPKDYSFNCTGSFTEDGNTINCYHGSVHGKVDLKKSFAKSCNSSFANIGSRLDASKFKKTAEELLFNKALPIKGNYQKSNFILDDSEDSSNILQASIGQGETLISPMHLCMLTQAIANGGMLVRPYYVDRIENYQGVVMKQYKKSTYGRIMSEEESEQLLEYMLDVVAEGTASALADTKYVCAGKTGSAEYSKDKKASHAWYTGISDYHGKKLVVTVLVENGGSGSKSAVPMAKTVFDKYYEGD